MLFVTALQGSATTNQQGFYGQKVNTQNGGYYSTSQTSFSTSNQQNVHDSNFDQNNQNVHSQGTGSQVHSSYGQEQNRLDSYNSQNQDRWVNKNYYGSYGENTNTNNNQQGSLSYGRVNKTLIVSTHSNNYNQNKVTDSIDQKTQESKNIFYGQNQNKSYHIPSSFPITDLNADYEFGNEDVALKVGAVEHKPKIPANVQSNRKRKDFCEPLDYHCSVDDCIPQSMVCDGVKVKFLHVC